MSKSTFIGGIRPYEGKRLSKERPIRDIAPKEFLTYPLSQHIGAPAREIVAVGDYVLTGQKIAEADGFMSVPIHASVSGYVKAIEPRKVVQGNFVKSIIIENDGLYDEIEYKKPKPYTEMTSAEIINLIKEAGIVGMGGAGFPAHVKLSPKDPNKIDYVIANCCECEPYLTSDYRKMLEEPEKLIEGMRIILRLFPSAHGIFAVEDNKKDCIRKLRQLTRSEIGMSVRVLHTKYPQGAERMLIYATTERKINSSMLPADAGCIVHNVDTIIAIRDAIIEGRPLYSRIVTVSGKAIRDPRNFRVRLGMNYEDLVMRAGGFVKEPTKILSGGPMMGIQMYDLDVPVTKATSALTCLTESCDQEMMNCINCGRCVEVCPERLNPKLLLDFAMNHDISKFIEYGGIECFECGCCSYKCPSKRHLTQGIKAMRKEAIALRKAEAGGKK